ncbi:hypothetical protein D3C76_901310 [compost metagenome]
MSGVKRADFARQAAERQAIATVRRQAELDGDIVQLQVSANVLPHRSVRSEFHQAGVVVADLQLFRRAEHAVGFDAAQLGLLDLEVARQFGADHGKRNLQARAHVGRAAHDLEGFAAVADLADTQLVGIGVLLGGKHFTHDDAAEYARGRNHGIDLEAGHGQTSHQLVTGNLRIYPAPQPLFTEFHPALLEFVDVRAA